MKKGKLLNVLLPAGTVVKMAGIPVRLKQRVEIETTVGNWKLIQEWEQREDLPSDGFGPPGAYSEPLGF